MIFVLNRMSLRLLKGKKNRRWSRGAGERSTQSICLVTRLEGLCVIRRIILNWVLKICYRNLGIGFIWFRTGTSGLLLLGIRRWTVVFHTGRRISWLTEVEDDPRVARCSHNRYAARGSHRLNSVYVVGMVFVALFTSSHSVRYKKWRTPVILHLYYTVLRRCRRRHSITAVFAHFDTRIISAQCSMFVINITNLLMLWGMTPCRIGFCVILRRRLTAYIYPHFLNYPENAGVQILLQRL